MKYSKFSIGLFLLLSVATNMYAAGESCKKCEALRDYHSKNPSKYTYYEDYLEDLEKNGGVLPEDPDFPKEYFNVSESKNEDSESK